jgi:dTMP kinase
VKKNPHKGVFIAFEGLDGSGSSTQVDLLVRNLKALGYSAFGTKEPTNNIVGGLIRGQLTGDWKASMECLQLLFAADRAHHLNREIVPSLRQGKIIVSDRYFFSTVAFGSLKLDRNWLLKLNEKFIYPDLTFVFKVSPKECLRRMKAGRNRLELFEEEKKLKRVWSTYSYLAKNNKNVFLVDGERSISQISLEIFEITKKLLKKKKIELNKNLFSN